MARESENSFGSFGREAGEKRTEQQRERAEELRKKLEEARKKGDIGKIKEIENELFK